MTRPFGKFAISTPVLLTADVRCWFDELCLFYCCCCCCDSIIWSRWWGLAGDRVSDSSFSSLVPISLCWIWLVVSSWKSSCCSWDWLMVYWNWCWFGVNIVAVWDGGNKLLYPASTVCNIPFCSSSSFLPTANLSPSWTSYFCSSTRAIAAGSWMMLMCF